MELVRVDRREVLLGPQARDVDGVLAVGEDLLVLARFGLALAPRVRRALRGTFYKNPWRRDSSETKTTELQLHNATIAANKHRRRGKPHS